MACGTVENNNFLHITDRLLGLTESVWLIYMVKNKKKKSHSSQRSADGETARQQDQTAATPSTWGESSEKKEFSSLKTEK